MEGAVWLSAHRGLSQAQLKDVMQGSPARLCAGFRKGSNVFLSLRGEPERER